MKTTKTLRVEVLIPFSSHFNRTRSIEPKTAQLVSTGFYHLREFSRCTSFSFSASLSCFTRKMTTTVWSIQCQWSDSQSRYQQHNQQQTQPVSEAFEYRLECDVDRFSELLCVYLLLSKCYCIIQPIIWGISNPPQKLLVMNIVRTWLGPTKHTEFGTKQTRFGGAYTIDRLKQK